MSSQRANETREEYKARRRATPRRVTRPRPTGHAPLAQGHRFNELLVCKHEGCSERHPATGPCLGCGELDQPEQGRAQG